MDQTDVKIQSREERKKLREQEAELLSHSEEQNERARKPKNLRVRLIPIWLRIIIVLVLIILFFLVGAMIGYGIIGDGDPFDVFKKSTWTHILDIVNKGVE